MSKFVATFLAIGSGAVLSVSLAYGEAGGGSRIDLAEGWTIQSSAKVAEKGEVISTSGFRTGRLVSVERADYSSGRAGEQQGLSRPVLRNEPPVHSGHDLQHRDEFLQHGHARRQPVRRALVVSHASSGCRPRSRGSGCG